MGQKRNQRKLSLEEQDTEEVSVKCRIKRSKSSTSSSDSHRMRDRAERSYWDSLSTLYLTPDALREFNRRNYLKKTSIPNTVPVLDHHKHYIARSHFARHGGPDLSDLRNYRNLEEVSTTPTLWSPRGGRFERNRKTLVDEEEETEASSAYDRNFSNHLAENHVFEGTFQDDENSANHQEWIEVLERPRASLSPSRMSDEYKAFWRIVYDARLDKSKLMAMVLPKILGKSSYPSGKNIKFENLEPLTQRMIDARPDYYEGHLAGPENRSIREALSTTIVPSSREDTPFLPNFILNLKDDGGSYGVTERQARYVGALAARGMYRLQSLQGTEIYDGNAYTISVTYYAQSLKFYTHHLTQPEGPGSRPHIHMVRLWSFSISNSPKQWREGLNAIRNASEKANEYREQFIKSANLRLGINTS